MQSLTDDKSPGALQSPAPGSFRELLYVSLPLIISSGSLSLMSAADRMMLAGYSADALAAVTPASMLHWSVVCVPLGTILYSNTFISQFDGAARGRDLAASFWHAVWLAVFGGLLLLLFIPWTHSALTLTGHTPAVVQQETDYFNVLCAGSVLLLLSNALGCFFSGRRKTRVVMYVNLFGVLVNFGLDYLLVFGVGPFPELGIRGAAIATLIARGTDIILFLILIRRENRTLRLPLSDTWRIDRRLLKKFLRFGLPSGLHYFVDNSAFTVFLLIVGSLSRDALAATNLAFSVNGLIFVPLLGFGTAVQTVVGHHIGAGLQGTAIRTTWNAFRMGLVWTGSAAVILLLFPAQSLQPFLIFASEATETGDSLRSILPTAALLIRFVAVYSVFDAMTVVFASALRGAGDTLFPMLVTLLSGWLVMTIPAFLIVSSRHSSVKLLWCTCTVHIAVMGSLMWWRFVSGKWKLYHITDA